MYKIIYIAQTTEGIVERHWKNKHRKQRFFLLSLELALPPLPPQNLNRVYSLMHRNWEWDGHHVAFYDLFILWWSPNRDLTSEIGKVTLLLVSMTSLFYGGVPRDLLVSMTCLFYGGPPIGAWPLRVGRSPCCWFLWLDYSMAESLGTCWYIWLFYSMGETL